MTGRQDPRIDARVQKIYGQTGPQKNNHPAEGRSERPAWPGKPRLPLFCKQCCHLQAGLPIRNLIAVAAGNRGPRIKAGLRKISWEAA